MTGSLDLDSLCCVQDGIARKPALGHHIGVAIVVAIFDQGRAVFRNRHRHKLPDHAAEVGRHTAAQSLPHPCPAGNTPRSWPREFGFPPRRVGRRTGRCPFQRCGNPAWASYEIPDHAGLAIVTHPLHYGRQSTAIRPSHTIAAAEISRPPIFPRRPSPSRRVAPMVAVVISVAPSLRDDGRRWHPNAATRRRKRLGPGDHPTFCATTNGVGQCQAQFCPVST